MPLVKFCHQCGCKHEYTLKPPIFCGSCGEVLDAKAAKEIKERKTIVVDSEGEEEQPKEESATAKRLKALLAKKGIPEEDEPDTDDDDDDDDIKEHVSSPIKKFTGLSVEIPKRKKETIGDIDVGAAPVSRKNLPSRPPGILPTKNKKQFLKVFSKLAGPSKNNNKDI